MKKILGFPRVLFQPLYSSYLDSSITALKFHISHQSQFRVNLKLLLPVLGPSALCFKAPSKSCNKYITLLYLQEWCHKFRRITILHFAYSLNTLKI